MAAGRAREAECDRSGACRADRRTRQRPGESRERGPVGDLHGAVGNRAVGALLADGRLQPKLRVGGPGGPSEREADRTAAQVTEAPESGAPVSVDERPPSTGAGAVPPPVEREVESASGGRPLPGPVRSFFEPRFGADLGGVRIHDGPEADRLNRRLDARAFTLGTDVYFGAGQYRPGTDAGDRLLAHELTHVIQQTGGGGDRPARTDGPAVVQRWFGDGRAGERPEDEAHPELSVGETVRTTANLNVREGPGLDRRVEVTTPVGATGDLVDGPVTADGYTWWKVSYHAGYTGWSAGRWLAAGRGRETGEGQETPSQGETPSPGEQGAPRGRQEPTAPSREREPPSREREPSTGQQQRESARSESQQGTSPRVEFTFQPPPVVRVRGPTPLAGGVCLMHTGSMNGEVKATLLGAGPTAAVNLQDASAAFKQAAGQFEVQFSGGRPVLKYRDRTFPLEFSIEATSVLVESPHSMRFRYRGWEFEWKQALTVRITPVWCMSLEPVPEAFFWTMVAVGSAAGIVVLVLPTGEEVPLAGAAAAALLAWLLGTA